MCFKDQHIMYMLHLGKAYLPYILCDNNIKLMNQETIFSALKVSARYTKQMELVYHQGVT